MDDSSTQPRRLGLPTKRFSLSDIGEGWSDCYIDYYPSVAVDLLSIQALAIDKDSPEATGLQVVVSIIESHLFGGHVMVVQDGKNSVVDIEPGDIKLLPLPTLRDLYAEMTGGALDPKDSASAPTPDAEPKNEPSTTTTGSSTGSESQPQSSTR